MARQLAFSLPAREALGRDDFLISPANARALAAIDAWADWPQGKMVLVGPAGSGKTHLTHVWARATGARIVAAHDLAGSDLPALAGAGRVAVEDADRLAAPTAPATGVVALLHLHNMVLADGGRLLLTAARAPAYWPPTLPDLASRIEAGAVAVLEPPDDAVLAALLVKQFADRQIAVPPALIPWLVQRMERSFAAVRDLAAALDARALAEGRAVSVALARELLDSDGGLRP